MHTEHVERIVNTMQALEAIDTPQTHHTSEQTDDQGAHDTDVAGGELEAVLVGIIGGGEGLHGVHRACNAFGLVVGHEDHHRNDAAVAVEQARDGLDALCRLHQRLRIARQHAPFEIAFVVAGIGQLRGLRH